MPVEKTETLPIRSEQDVVSVRQTVKAWAAQLSFSLVDQTKIVTAASELGRNTLIYGGGGSAKLEVLIEGMRRGLRVTFEDQGPGIPDIDQALQDGYTSGKGMGLGLSGSKRLVNEFKIASRVGEGTTVTIIRWK
ncbi:MAG: anti-sigma regulatory factor [Chthonomonadales bacterium]|nr:anti-sigma regulatory factor [Chthonomonadales bacterium]